MSESYRLSAHSGKSQQSSTACIIFLNKAMLDLECLGTTTMSINCRTSAVWRSVLESIELLDRVVEQTIVYFKRSWAKYDEARRGGLRLTPPTRIVESLKRDYREMRPMFFNEPPSLDQILEHLPELEQEINSRIE